MRWVGLCASVSIAAVGLLGALSADLAGPPRALPLTEAMRAGEGAHVFVRGLLERIRPVGGSAALASLTDCNGVRAPVFFPAGAPDRASFTLVAVRATLASYRGVLELVVQSPADVEAVAEGAAMVAAEDLSEDWRPYTCRPVAVWGTVAWGALLGDDGQDAEVGLLTRAADLKVVVHSDAYIELSVEVGARASFLGVVAQADAGDGPAVHVRI